MDKALIKRLVDGAISRAGGRQAWWIYSKAHREGFVATEIMQWVAGQMVSDDQTIGVSYLSTLYRETMAAAGVTE